MVDLIISIISMIWGFAYAALIHPYNKMWQSLLAFVLTVIITYVVLMVLFWLVCILISLTINTQREYKSYSRFYGVMFSLIYECAAYLAGARVSVTGMNKLPRDARFLFVSNHISNFDTFIQAGTMRRFPIAFISKPENFKIPMGHRYMSRCLYMALDRDDVRNGANVISRSAQLIKDDICSVGVYPEGTRNPEGKGLLDFKPGCFKAALWAKCPIVVSTIQGTNGIHKNFPFRRTRVRMTIVEVISYNQIKEMNTQEIAELVKNIMNNKLREETQ